jgi:hypothetical protein
MATSNQEVQQQGVGDEERLAALWTKLAEDLKAEDQARQRLQALKDQEPDFDQAMASNRKEAFKLMRGFEPEGMFNDTRASDSDNRAATKGLGSVELMIRGSGVKDSYNEEGVASVGNTSERADNFRARNLQSFKENLARTYPSADGVSAFADLNRSPLENANAAVNMSMEARQAKELDAAKGDPKVAATHKLEQQLFALRQNDDVTHYNAQDRAREKGEKMPKFASRTPPAAELADRLMEKPAREIEAFRNARTLQDKTNAMRGDYFDFSKKNSRATATAMGEYSQGLVGKLAIRETAQEVMEKGSEVQKTQRQISGLLRAKGDRKVKGMPQFDEEHLQHFANLNPSDHNDRKLIEQAAAMLSQNQNQDQLPQALQAVANGVAQYQASQATQNQTEQGATQNKQGAQAQDQGTSQTTVQQKQAEQAQSSSQAEPQKQGAQMDMTERDRAQRNLDQAAGTEKVYGKTTPEERARRGAQMDYFDSKGISSSSSHSEIAKVHKEFQERWQAQQRERERQATEAQARAQQQTVHAARTAAPAQGRSR